LTRRRLWPEAILDDDARSINWDFNSKYDDSKQAFEH